MPISTLPLLRTYSPNLPAVNVPVGALMVVGGIAWLLLEGPIISSSRNVWKAFNLGWMWSDRLMRVTHKIAAGIFMIAGILILVNAR